MKTIFRTLIFAALALSVPVWAADEKADVGANHAAQAAADAIRAKAGSDIAFIAAGFLKENFKKEDLSTMLQYPTDEIVVLNLTGEKIRAAMERSLKLYPQPNPSFLQISGMEVTFKKSASANSRVQSITVGGSNLEASKTYTVAMPSLLASGGLGYFQFWENEKPVKKFPKTTLEDILKGKKSVESSPRWTAQS